jgi:hypothetical protein
MLGYTAHIAWDDIGQSVPAFLTIIIMPFTYSGTLRFLLVLHGHHPPSRGPWGTRLWSCLSLAGGAAGRVWLHAWLGAQILCNHLFAFPRPQLTLCAFCIPELCPPHPLLQLQCALKPWAEPGTPGCGLRS